MVAAAVKKRCAALFLVYIALFAALLPRKSAAHLLCEDVLGVESITIPESARAIPRQQGILGSVYGSLRYVYNGLRLMGLARRDAYLQRHEAEVFLSRYESRHSHDAGFASFRELQQALNQSLNNWSRMRFRSWGLQANNSESTIFVWKKTPIKPGQSIHLQPARFTLEQLTAYFQAQLPASLSPIAIETIKVMNQGYRVAEWATELRQEVLNTMWADGLRTLDAYENAGVRELYLDRVLAKRALIQSLAVEDSTALPVDLLHGSSSEFFSQVLAQGKLFIDWYGAGLSGRPVNGHVIMHSARGHALQMVYVADHVPRFVELLKYIGQTQDVDQFWSLVFDNANSGNLPVSSGKWVFELGDYLGIRS